MSKFIDRTISSRAITRSGRIYTGARIANATHILDIPAELAALVRAVHHNDTEILAVETTVTETSATVSPLVLKLLADHSTRTGTPIQYTLRSTHGTTVFATDDARTMLPSYASQMPRLASLAARDFAPAKIPADAVGDDLTSALKKAARDGITRNFPTRDGASGYGAAVRATDGALYFGGQYSTPDERLGAHAEMAVLIHALLDGATGFTHLALASSKFKDVPASPCGCCRQFLADTARATESEPHVHLFAMETDATAVYTLDELLPAAWTNRT